MRVADGQILSLLAIAGLVGVAAVRGSRGVVRRGGSAPETPTTIDAETRRRVLALVEDDNWVGAADLVLRTTEPHRPLRQDPDASLGRRQRAFMTVVTEAQHAGLAHKIPEAYRSPKGSSGVVRRGGTLPTAGFCSLCGKRPIDWDPKHPPAGFRFVRPPDPEDGPGEWRYQGELVICADCQAEIDAEEAAYDAAFPPGPRPPDEDDGPTWEDLLRQTKN